MNTSFVSEHINAHTHTKIGDDLFDTDVIAASKKHPVIVALTDRFVPSNKERMKTLETSFKDGLPSAKFITVDVEDRGTGNERLLNYGLPLDVLPLIIAFSQGLPVALMPAPETAHDIETFTTEVKTQKQAVTAFNILLLRGHALLRAGDASTAQQLFNLILNEDPQNILAWCGLIDGLLQADDEAAARQAYADIPHEITNTPSVKAIAAKLALKKQGREADENLESVRSAFERHPHDPAASCNMARLLNNAGKKDEVLEILLTTLKNTTDGSNKDVRELLNLLFLAWGAVNPHTLRGQENLTLLSH